MLWLMRVGNLPEPKDNGVNIPQPTTGELRIRVKVFRVEFVLQPLGEFSSLHKSSVFLTGDVGAFIFG